MNLENVEKTLNYLFDNNLKLVEQGLPKITINLVSDAGVGKSSIVEEIAQSRGAEYVKIYAANLSETGDLLGMPIREVAIEKDDKQIWVFEKTVDSYIKDGWFISEKTPRMSYAVPNWLPKDVGQEVIFNIDDISRAPMCVLQSLLEVIQNGRFTSWELPKKCHIVTTSNFDNGHYNVTSLDSAFYSRILTITVDFDVNIWAKWAVDSNIRSEFINFALLNPNVFETKNNSVNARNYTLFANACNNIKNLEKDLLLVTNLAKASFGEEEHISTQFSTFIYNKLHQLPSPDKLLKTDFDIITEELNTLLNSGDTYRTDLASVLTLRFNLYIQKYFKESSDKNKTEKVMNRIIDYITYNQEKHVLLSSNLLFILIKDLYKYFPNRVSKYISNPIVKSVLL